MFNPFNRQGGVDSSTLKLLLEEVLTPVAAILGMKKKGDYLWGNSGTADLRYGLKYSLIKGDRGTFTWGVCANYIPMVSGKTLKFCRTEKSFDFHLFEWTDEYASSFSGGSLQNGVVNHGTINGTRDAIAQLAIRYESKIRQWIESASTNDALIELTRTQINNTGWQYKVHHPAPVYILPYLYAYSKMRTEAITEFDALDPREFNNDHDVRLKAHAYLLKLLQ